MNKKKIIVFIAVFIGICGFGSVTYTSYIYSHKFKENMMDYSENKKDKESYVLSLLDTHEKSEVISSIITSSKIVCLSFEGIDDDETMTRVLELLDKYNIKATFIVSGIDAAENSDMVKKITDQGHEISYRHTAI